MILKLKLQVKQCYNRGLIFDSKYPPNDTVKVDAKIDKGRKKNPSSLVISGLYNFKYDKRYGFKLPQE